MGFDEQLADRLRDCMADRSAVTEKRMFGGLAFLVNGNMAVSTSGEGGLLLRVKPEQTSELLARPHALPCVMRGRTMTGWLRVAIDGTITEDELGEWVQIGIAYARSLPPK